MVTRKPGRKVPTQHNHTYLAAAPLPREGSKELPVLDARGPAYPPVDVAIVMESTYPYLKGGVSAVVHDIVTSNQDLTFGILHIAWDSAPHEDLYGVPPMSTGCVPATCRCRSTWRTSGSCRRGAADATRPRRLADRVFDAIDAIVDGDPQPMWQLYDNGMNPRTRSIRCGRCWAPRSSCSSAVPARTGLPLTDTFWLLREFFSSPAPCSEKTCRWRRCITRTPPATRPCSQPRGPARTTPSSS